MRSLKALFIKVSKKYERKPTFDCFEIAIANQNFSEQTVRRWFRKLVDPSEYDKCDMQEHLQHLIDLTRGEEDLEEDDLEEEEDQEEEEDLD